MKLTLAVISGGVGEGASAFLRLDRRGAIIGRAADSQLWLPDDQGQISARHLEVRYEAEAYWLVDHSTEGTFIDDVRLHRGELHRITSKHTIRIGRYEVLAEIVDDGGSASDVNMEVTWPESKVDTMSLLRHLVRGVIRMIDARSHAKARLGLHHTAIVTDGDNPLRLCRSADRALELLLAPPAAGFMSAVGAIDDAFAGFQAHEVAMIAAARTTLSRSIARFSPAAIRAPHGRPGWLQRMWPYREEAALWRKYESEFEQAVSAFDATFTEILADEFQREYYDSIARSKEWDSDSRHDLNRQ